MKQQKDYSQIVASFSGGRSSALMTKILCDNDKNTIVVFANTGKEHEKTLKFVHDFEVNFGIKIVWLESENSKQGFRIVDYNTASRIGEPFESLIKKRKYLPNVMTRFCTTELKIRPISKYMQSLGFKNWTNAIGFRYDEPNRIAKINKRKERYNTTVPLNDFCLTKQDVLEFWSKQVFDLDIPEYLGNCDCCFLKGINKIKKIEKETPKMLDWWISQESKIGATFRKDRPLKMLRYLVATQPMLWDNLEQQDIDCMCNVD